MKMDIAYFQSVEGSMTSDHGQTRTLHVKRPAASLSSFTSSPSAAGSSE
jgi:hypothetical protein